MPTTTKTKPTENGAKTNRRPSEQALEVVDVAVGAVPVANDAVRKTVKQWSDSETRSHEQAKLQKQIDNLRHAETRPAQIEALKKRLQADVERAKAEGSEVRRRVTDDLVEQARKARKRVEPVTQRVEPLVKNRVEPVYRQRVEPVYRRRFEPAVKRVRERI